MIRKLLLLLMLALLAGCGGGNNAESGHQQPADTHSPSGLQFSAEAAGTDTIVTLMAAGAEDLYQVAASIRFPADKYEIVAIDAGGGLGGPADTFFAGNQVLPGQVDFGYTKRYAGPGVYGDVSLLRLRIAHSDEIDLADFTIDRDGTPPVARDSRRQQLDLVDAGGAR